MNIRFFSRVNPICRTPITIIPVKLVRHEDEFINVVEATKENRSFGNGETQIREGAQMNFRAHDC